ncbi:MAG: hypothetical protein A2X94_16965 [Bdellovibrionales bacterium GWB1_55_8]|nr:MAG: hypothetical protein A2X94_16965 [Bdellovibrionales bacterium GWB1_55_8]
MFAVTSVVVAGCSHYGTRQSGDREPASPDGYRSSIDGIDLGTVYQPPSNVAPIICQRYKKDPKTQADDVNMLEACQMGVGAARYMAERYSQNEGKYLGCVDGLQQGLGSGYFMTKDPNASQLEEARKRYVSTKMESAITRATAQARKDGQRIADDVIISRFRAVVGNNQEPDGNYDYPAHSFGGFDDGYIHDRQGGSFDEVYKLGWVDKGVRDFRAIEARAVHRLHKETYAPNKLCQPVEALFTENLTLWDYFAARGKYNFEKYGWRDETRSLNYFRTKLSGTTEVLFYNAIQGRMMEQKYQVEIQPARREGIPGTEVIETLPDGKTRLKRDEQGNIVYGQYRDIPAVVETRTRMVPDPDRSKAYYQGIFHETFTEAYRDFYITQYFGLGFVSAHRQSQAMGELVGQMIGKIVAADYADFLAYDNKYRQDSVGAYNIEWKTNYDAQWSRIWKVFAEHAVVEIDDLSLFGDLDDDIFQAGERVKATLALTNLGRKSEDIAFQMYGALSGAAQTFTWPARNVPISNRFGVETPFLGQIDKNIGPRQTASIGIKARGPVEFDTSLNTKKGKNLTINEVAEIDAANASVNELTGSGGVQIKLVNPSKLESPAMITLRVILGNNLGRFEQETLKMAGKETRMVSVQFAQLDPLDVIRLGGVSGTVQSVMGGRVLHERSFSAGVPAQYIAIAKYFNALAIGPDGAVATGSDDRMGRLQEVMAIIQQMTQEDIRNDVDWDKPGSLDHTVVGQLGKMFLSSKAAGKLNAEAQNYYNELGKNLNTLEVGMFSRKAFRKALNTFAPDVKVKKKNK